MHINAIKLKLVTERGPYGFEVPFDRHLTIIKGNNSSGKSTLFLCILYGLGMEELAGGKGESVLPYAVKDWFNYGGERVNVLASEVYVEIENSFGQTVTLCRSIKDPQKSTKLVEVLDGSHLTGSPKAFEVRPTYLHDPGGAQKAEGFHNFLEKFLGFTLPTVPTSSGGETRLYLQAIFAALAVEQKRGWTDYIANIPFFGIRDARTRVVEFLLALDVFETNAERHRLDIESVAIAAAWESIYQGLRRTVEDVGVTIQGVPPRVTALFDPVMVQLQKRVNDKTVPLATYMSSQRTEYGKLSEKANSYQQMPDTNSHSDLDAVTQELHRLTNLYETASATFTLQSGSVREYEQLYSEAHEDLVRNKTVRKLRSLGATDHAIELASDHCPTCHQHVEDSLLIDMTHGPQMDLDTNITYLEKQSRMLERQIAGGKNAIEETELLLKELSFRLSNTRMKLNALRSDVATGATESRAIIREQVQIEVEAERLQKAEAEAAQAIARLVSVAARLRENQSARTKLPKDYYSPEDIRKIRVFEKLFRANAGSFGYESAAIEDIEINNENLVPFLSHLELREIIVKKKQDIKVDSSASDFVRLIWSYLLALHQASTLPNGGNRHPGILLLDEPGQHSMAESSQRALLQQLASNKTLQGIVAASFDESDAVFQEVTQGISFKLIEISEKSIVPLTKS
jgi:hypothetical protein